MARTSRRRQQSAARHGRDRRRGRTSTRELKRIETRRKAVNSYIAIGVVAIILIGGVGFVFLRPELKLDLDTLCKIDEYPSGHTVVLIDGTDRIPRSDLRYLKGIIRDERKTLEIHDKLSLVRVSETRDDDDSHLQEFFALCNPGDGSQYSELFDSTKRRQDTWEKKFGAPLAESLEQFSDLDEANNTPLIEAISEISRQQDFSAKNVARRRLIIVSDMLHHTSEFSQYRGGYSIDSFNDISAYKNGLPLLDDVEISIHYVNRKKAASAQNEVHRLFWSDFLELRGSNKVEFDPQIN